MRQREPVPGNLFRVPPASWNEAERWAVDWLRDHPEESLLETDSFRALAGLSAGKRLFAVDRKPAPVPESEWTEEERAAVSGLKQNAEAAASGQLRPGDRVETERRTGDFRAVELNTPSGERQFVVFRKPQLERQE